MTLSFSTKSLSDRNDYAPPKRDELYSFCLECVPNNTVLHIAALDAAVPIVLKAGSYW